VVTTRVLNGNYTLEQQEAALQLLETAEAALQACETALSENHMVWQYKKCSATVFRSGLVQLNALKLASAPQLAAP
jgi:hypothetical protein